MIMTKINLLPWREELRQEQKKQFLMMVVMTFVLSAAMVGLGLALAKYAQRHLALFEGGQSFQSARQVSAVHHWKFARFGSMPDGSQLEEPKGMERIDFDDSGEDLPWQE